MTHSSSRADRAEPPPSATRWLTSWPAVAALYALVGFAVYARILDDFFLADDWAFLAPIEQTPSVGVLFSPLAERYFRPMVVLVYYLNFKLSGLAPLTYHVSLVAIHVASAVLLYVFGRRALPERGPLAPLLGGLLFLVFGGHAEAVTYIAGVADPLLLLCVLTFVLLFLRGLEREHPLPAFAGSWVAFALALFTKESATVMLAIGTAAAVLAAPAWPDRRRLRRTLLWLSVPLPMVVAYVLLRAHVLGFTFLNLQDMGTSANPIATARAFVVRSFLPAGEFLSTVWLWRLDVIVLAPLALGLFAAARRETRRGLVLLGVCLTITLAPVMPLSIAIHSPQSERFIYLPSAFASLLTIYLIDAVTRRRAIVLVIALLLCGWHVRALDRSNRAWEAAASITEGIVTSFTQLMRERGRPGRAVYVLNAPDNLRGAYIWRRGFYEALRLMAPNQVATMAQTHVVSVHSLFNETSPVEIEQIGESGFRVAVRGGDLIGPPSYSRFWQISDWQQRSFTVTFNESAPSGLVVSFTPDRTRVVGTVSSALPFGTVDRPVDPLSCASSDPELLGWALDDEGGTTVTIEVEGMTDPASATAIGIAERVSRPDVESAYPNAPESATAGWRFSIPCGTLRSRTRGQHVTVRIVAENTRGRRALIGSQTLVF